MRTVLITGSSRGIGAETARLFAKKGYTVYINYNKSEGIVETADIYFLNGTSDKRMFREIAGIDILVNNAGIAQTKLFTDITDSDWNNMISSNLSSAFYCCREALPHMIRQRFGRIINISSMWGQVGGSCEVHYSASKAGIIGLTKALAMEEGLSGITVNCIAPGVIKTDMTSNLSEDDFTALKDETPTNSIGTPFDVARTVLFLASDNSSFITGQVLGINGGFVV